MQNMAQWVFGLIEDISYLALPVLLGCVLCDYEENVNKGLPEAILLTCFNFKTSMDITFPVNFGMNLFIFSKILMVAPLKFGNGKVFSSHTL